MDLPRDFTIRERNHRIHNPLTAEKLATLGRAIGLQTEMSVLDLACGSGEMLCTWSRDHAIIGTGIDISTVSIGDARARAVEFGVGDRVIFRHGDAAGYVAATPVDVAACVGATWIGGGIAGTIAQLQLSIGPGGMLLVGEPFWKAAPPDQATVDGCHASAAEDYRDLPGLVELFGQLGWDLVEMVLADEDSWDRYVAAQWITVRNWLNANPQDELAGEFRIELDTAPLRYVRFLRPYLGWGVFALMRR